MTQDGSKTFVIMEPGSYPRVGIYVDIIKDSIDRAHFHSDGKCHRLHIDSDSVGIIWKRDSSSIVDGVLCRKSHS